MTTSSSRMLCAMLALAASAPIVRAGDPDPWLYALDDLGRLSIAGTLLEDLPGGYDPKDLQNPQGTSRWMAFDVVGSDRFALRLDGYVQSNGLLVGLAPFALVKYTPYWRRLGVGAGVTWALRTDGLLAQDGTAVALLPASDFDFTDLIVIDLPPAEPEVLSLRSDGAVFRGTELAPLFQLVGGKGVFSQSEGLTADTKWLRLAYDDVSGLVYALRADGKLRSLDPAGPPPPPPGTDEELPPEAGVAVAELPFKKKAPFGVRHLYVDVAFTDDGSFHVLRTDGRVYRADDVEEPLFDLPGNGRRAAVRFVDLVSQGASVYALRRDGRVYRDAELLLDLPGGRFTQLALSDTPPDLAMAAPHAPELARWTARAIVGEALELPVLATDVDLADDALVIDVDLSGAPDATYDPDARAVTVTPLSKGVQKIGVTVDDGDGGLATSTFKIKASEPHPGPANRRPLVSRVSPVTVATGRAFALPVRAVDPDGDPLTVTIDADATPLALGASFDADAAILNWTPTLAAVGRHSVRFTVSDGQRTKKLRVRLKVVASLVP
ncbi:MAG: hypothetical protein H6825_13785 [Planctomycetes bacterium]|nr:hypothetical protein [Planctomycetota bacterium]